MKTVMVPGATLEPGKYVMKLHDSLADRHIVQVFNEDQSKIIATILAIPNRRLEPTGDTVFWFWETPAGEPKALRAWFFPGDLFGQEFAYPREDAKRISANNRNEHVPSVEGDDLTTAQVYRSEEEYASTDTAENRMKKEQDWKSSQTTNSSTADTSSSTATNDRFGDNADRNRNTTADSSVRGNTTAPNDRPYATNPDNQAAVNTQADANRNTQYGVDNDRNTQYGVDNDRNRNTQFGVNNDRNRNTNNDRNARNDNLYAQNRNSDSGNNNRSNLPDTASNIGLLALAGLALFGSGACT